ncbi:MAG TPA: class I SAM-dependent methyltransferase [Solirubrobacteraceae bacterium]|nr:class I SAM-dependent methyltransferase [Solirubrobacteraceae bacterium]
MTDNLRSGYHEALWRGVPEGASPPGIELRRAFLLQHLGVLTPSAEQGVPLRVLDVGCGEGQLTAAIVEAGCAVLGIDLAEEPLRRARERHPELELLRVEDDRPWPIADASFDVVWAGETIEHVLDTTGWLSEVRRVLRSGGSLLLSTPAHGPLTRLSFALSPARFERHFDPRADHLRFYTARTLRRLLTDFRFEQVETSQAGGLPGARGTLFAAALRARF